MVLSDLGANVGKTFCGACYRGVVTVGPVSGEYSKQREELLKAQRASTCVLGSFFGAGITHAREAIAIVLACAAVFLTCLCGWAWARVWARA